MGGELDASTDRAAEAAAQEGGEEWGGIDVRLAVRLSRVTSS